MDGAPLGTEQLAQEAYEVVLAGELARLLPAYGLVVTLDDGTPL
jgi:hypothetical protein